MRITSIHIQNYRSFGPKSEPFHLPTSHVALVGKNNVGKSNIFQSLDLVLGARNPSYIRLQLDDFHDQSQPIFIKIELGDISDDDKGALFSVPNITKQQIGALSSQLAKNQNPVISMALLVYPENFSAPEPIEQEEDSAEGQEQQSKKFEIKLWGFAVHRKIDDVRRALIRFVKTPAIRDVEDELSASRWTSYGQLMKEVLEDSPKYPEISNLLAQLNEKIQEVFSEQKDHLLKGASVVSYVDDITFQLTKENKPSELLRNLEVFIQEGDLWTNIAKVGTGTQSAIIIGILELVLKGKHSRTKVFGIEEPEAYIHPHGIRYLGQLLRDIAESSKKTQVIISTHSPSLVATFDPKEIIRISKKNGASLIFQPKGALMGDAFKRFVNVDNSDMFFSDRIFFVEGDTERHLFPALSKKTLIDPSRPELGFCDFDKANIGIVPLNGMASALHFLTISQEFETPAIMLLDKDFLEHQHCAVLCQKLNIDSAKLDKAQIVKALSKLNIFVNTKGEIEDLIPDADLADASGLSEAEIKTIKENCSKTSQAFKKIFNTRSKASYALILADYYLSSSSNPCEKLIRKVYSG